MSVFSRGSFCLLLGLLAVSAVGCASARQSVALPDQSQHVEDPAKGRIYVIRPATIGSAIGMNVQDGDTYIGKTGPNSYLCWEREPGTVSVSGHAENTSYIQFIVEEGRRYYVLQELKIGLMLPRNNLVEISEAQAEKWLQKMKPPKTNVVRN